MQNQKGKTTEVFQNFVEKVLSKYKILTEFTPSKSFPSPELLRRNVHALLAYLLLSHEVFWKCQG